jgi:hypothetical protein
MDAGRGVHGLVVDGIDALRINVASSDSFPAERGDRAGRNGGANE